MATTDSLSMVDSTDDAEDPALLRERMEVEGYLYFRRLVEPTRALQVKREIMDVLRAHFLIAEPVEDEPLWSGGPEPTEVEWMAVYDRIVRLESFQQLARSPEIVAVLEAVCGEPIQVWEQQLIRAVFPDPDTTAPRGLGAHQDGDPKLGYQADRFYTGWVSLMDIDHTIGGLAVSPGSHTLGLLQSGGTVSATTKDDKSREYGLDASTLEWATAEYEPGSAVIFFCRTVHRGLPNHSDRIRLSCDYRYQAATGTASWVAHTLGPDVRRGAQEIDETLSRRAFYLTARPTPAMMDEVRQRMLEERNATLVRARELVLEIKHRDSVAH